MGERLREPWPSRNENRFPKLVIQYMIAINVTGYGVMLDSWRVTLIGFLMFIVRAVIDS